jgi:hypothetical protein
MERVPPPKRNRHPHRRGPVRLFSDEEVYQLRTAYNNGATIVELARESGGSETTVTAAVFGLGYYSGV